MMKKMIVCLLAVLLALPCAMGEQVALPAPDASLYESDPFLRTVTQLMTDYEHARRTERGYYAPLCDDWSKAITIVTLHMPTVRTEGDRATVFARVFSGVYALYGGTRMELVTGALVPSRIELEMREGAWAIVSVRESEDGSHFWPSILEFCDGDELLARTLTLPVGAQKQDMAVRLYLNSIGYENAAIE